MAQEPAITLRTDIINHYIQTLSKEIDVDGVLLFGSFAYGNPTKHSDVDLVVVSPDFKGKDFWDRVGWLSQKRDVPTFQIAMDVFGYTPEEFEEADQFSSIMKKAKKDGVWLFRK